MADIRVSDMPQTSGCISDTDRLYLIKDDGVGGFTSHNIEYTDFVASVHSKSSDCYGHRFIPCRLALKEIIQNFGGNIFTESHGTVDPDAALSGATDKFQYYRYNIHINNRLSTAKSICVADLACEDCTNLNPIVYAKLGLYLNSSSYTTSPSGEQLMSAWLMKGANNGQGLVNFDAILEDKNGTTPLSETAKLNMYGIDDTIGNLGISTIKKDSFDNGTEGSATYYSMIIELDPLDPQLTLDIMLTYTWDTASGDKWSNHPDPTDMKVEGMLYLEGFYS
jgi:hypothetical protein